MPKETMGVLKTAMRVMTRPYDFLKSEAASINVRDVVRYYVALSVILAFMTPLANIAGFPSDVIHASTNAQMGAYRYSSLLEQWLGASRHLWTGALTLVLMLVKLPVFVAFYHIFALLLGGKGDLKASLKVAVYPATPAMLFGWVPYSDFLFGLWVAFFLVPAFRYLHEVRWGRAIAFVTVMVGLQILYVVLTCGGWLIEP